MTAGATASDSAQDSQRVDQWLWFARLVKSRTLGQALIERGKIRLNRMRLEKASHSVKAGDVLTLSLGPRVRVIEIKAIGKRRGPAAEAQALFTELTPATDRTRCAVEPAEDAAAADAGLRPHGSGRPTKRDRRQIDRLHGR